ncbi:hypothetical protein, partial [Rhodococcus sp. KB6]|uniref:hypothetical protein n=1 Tax=Rhodococcus sp. KB6 TaxID=1752066 RepID=UPI000B0687E3
MATKCAINGRQWGAYDGRRQTLEAEVRSAIEDMSKQFDDFETSWSDGPGCGPDDAYELTKWFDNVIAAYEKAETYRGESSDLLRRRLPLIDSAEAEIAHMGLDPAGWTRLILVSDQGKREDLTRWQRKITPKSSAATQS